MALAFDRRPVVKNLVTNEEWLTEGGLVEENGALGSQLKFNGSDARSISSILPFKGYPFSIILTGKNVASPNSSCSVILSDNTVSVPNAAVGIYVHSVTNLVKGFLYKGSTLYSLDGVTQIGNNEYFTMVFVGKSTNDRRMLLNGRLEAVTAETVTYPSGINRVSVGSLPREAPVYYDGSIAGVFCYDRDLSDEEVRAWSTDPWAVYRPEPDFPWAAFLAAAPPSASGAALETLSVRESTTIRKQALANVAERLAFREQSPGRKIAQGAALDLAALRETVTGSPAAAGQGAASERIRLQDVTQGAKAAAAAVSESLHTPESGDGEKQAGGPALERLRAQSLAAGRKQATQSALERLRAYESTAGTSETTAFGSSIERQRLGEIVTGRKIARAAVGEDLRLRTTTSARKGASGAVEELFRFDESAVTIRLLSGAAAERLRLSGRAVGVVGTLRIIPTIRLRGIYTPNIRLTGRF